MVEIPEPDLPPLVLRVAPVSTPPPRPGLFAAALLTFGYWVVLIGGMLAVVMLALGWNLAFGEKADLDDAHGSNPVEKMPPVIRAAMAWSFPAGYLFGLIYSVIVLRIVIGRSWMRDIGLRHLPPFHLMLGLISLPGFIILSDLLAHALQPLDHWTHSTTGIPGVGDTSAALRSLFENFHWSMAVFAIGLGPGVVEELWCRGFLGRGFIGRYGWFVGIGLSSAFFGMLHLWPPSYVLITALMGACLHFTYIASRSLWVPIAMHFTNNSFAGLASVGAISTESTEAALTNQPLLIVLLAGGLMLCCGLAMWQARWTWSGERRGELIPTSLDAPLAAAQPNPILPLAGGAFCVVLVWMLL